MRHLKLATAIILLLCTVLIPPDWHKWIHYAAMLAFAVMAYHEFIIHNPMQAAIPVVMAIVFQPYYQPAANSMTWTAIHVACAIILIIMWIKELHRKT